MTIESVLGLSLAMLILAASPGPGVFASVAQALSSGFRSSLNTIAGIVVGDIVFLMLAIFGLSIIAQLLGEVFFIIKILGGVYLIWLGWKTWKAEPVPFHLNNHLENRSSWQIFLSGLFITLGNPKAIIFYIGFLPTFINLTSLSLLDISIIIAIITLVLSGVLIVYTFTASNARRLFTSRKASKNLNRCAGTVMVGTGVVIVSR